MRSVHRFYFIGRARKASLTAARRCAFVRRFCASCCVSIGVTRSNACAWPHTLHCNVHGSDLAVAAPRWPQIGHMIAIRATVYTFKGQGTQRARSSPSPHALLNTVQFTEFGVIGHKSEIRGKSSIRLRDWSDSTSLSTLSASLDEAEFPLVASWEPSGRPEGLFKTVGT